MYSICLYNSFVFINKYAKNTLRRSLLSFPDATCLFSGTRIPPRKVNEAQVVFYSPNYKQPSANVKYQFSINLY